MNPHQFFCFVLFRVLVFIFWDRVLFGRLVAQYVYQVGLELIKIHLLSTLPPPRADPLNTFIK